MVLAAYEDHTKQKILITQRLCFAEHVMLRLKMI